MSPETSRHHASLSEPKVSDPWEDTEETHYALRPGSRDLCPGLQAFCSALEAVGSFVMFPHLSRAAPSIGQFFLSF